jgi:hypothetical protein
MASGVTAAVACIRAGIVSPKATAAKGTRPIATIIS